MSLGYSLSPLMPTGFCMMHPGIPRRADRLQVERDRADGFNFAVHAVALAGSLGWGDAE
jgi:hypothetical protein